MDLDKLRVGWLMQPEHTKWLKPPGHPNYPLSFKFYARNYCVIPTTILVFSDCCWMAWSTIWGFCRTNVVLSRHGFKSKRQDELIDLLIHPRNRKYITVYQTYEPQPELYNAYVAMNKAAEEKGLA